MDAAAGLSFRHTLYTMHTTLIFQAGIGSDTVDHKGNLFESSDTILIQAQHLCLPATSLRVFHQHAVDLCRKQRSLITTGTGTDLYDNVFLIIGILGEKSHF